MVADYRANRHDPKARFVLVLFRLSQAAMGNSRTRRLLFSPLEMSYRLLTEGLLGLEIRPKTSIGPGLSIYHGFGIVINDGAILGSRVQLRNGVTVGHRRIGGGVPRIGDDVNVGAGAIILGDIEIGHGAVIGAGSVVLTSVPAGDVVAGNPARSVRPGSVSFGKSEEEGIR
ncbi:serine O-acetyltransferase [Aeromicrobium piscarium]|nr:serine acetyltransferase [Aeromicrobium piscarium]